MEFQVLIAQIVKFGMMNTEPSGNGMYNHKILRFRMQSIKIDITRFKRDKQNIENCTEYSRSACQKLKIQNLACQILKFH